MCIEQYIHSLVPMQLLSVDLRIWYLIIWLAKHLDSNQYIISTATLTNTQILYQTAFLYNQFLSTTSLLEKLFRKSRSNMPYITSKNTDI